MLFVVNFFELLSNGFRFCLGGDLTVCDSVASWQESNIEFDFVASLPSTSLTQKVACCMTNTGEYPRETPD